MIPKENRKCKQLLSLLDDKDLSSLLGTVMKRETAVENRDEAIEVILSHSSSAAELLQRQKIRRKVLLQYLTSKRVSVAANVEKSDLIHKDSGPGIVVGKPVKRESPALTATISNPKLFSQASAPGIIVRKPVKRESPAVTATISNPNLLSQASASDIFVGRLAKRRSHAGLSTEVQETKHPNEKQKNQVNGQEFAMCFYERLNAKNPALSSGSLESSLGSEDFWENCSLKIVDGRPIANSVEKYTGSLMVSKRLKNLVKQENLLFNPNVSEEGIRSMESPYGQHMVMVCGTIHQQDRCIGTFEQMFGLVQNPGTNNWKIKITSLRLQRCVVTSFPIIRRTADQDMLKLAEESMKNQIF